MYGMIDKREDRHAADRAAGEHVEHAGDPAGILLEDLGQRAGSTPGTGI